MSTVRSGHAAALLPNGRVLIAGGSAASTILSSAELYDPAANRWTPAAAMAQERVGHTAIVLPGGEVLVAGGYNTSHDDGSFGAKLLNQAERYNPATNRWTPAGTLFQGRVGHTMTLLPGGQVLIAGGQLDPTAYLATTERYDPATNRWSATAKLRDRRSGHTATLLADGRVLVAGGQDGPDWLASVEWYDSQANTWISG
jgi:N-acetylneuraminic acid mutarotase